MIINNFTQMTKIITRITHLIYSFLCLMIENFLSPGEWNQLKTFNITKEVKSDVIDEASKTKQIRTALP